MWWLVAPDAASDWCSWDMKMIIWRAWILQQQVLPPCQEWSLALIQWLKWCKAKNVCCYHDSLNSKLNWKCVIVSLGIWNISTNLAWFFVSFFFSLMYRCTVHFFFWLYQLNNHTFHLDIQVHINLQFDIYLKYISTSNYRNKGSYDINVLIKFLLLMTSFLKLCFVSLKTSNTNCLLTFSFSGDVKLRLQKILLAVWHSRRRVISKWRDIFTCIWCKEFSRKEVPVVIESYGSL